MNQDDLYDQSAPSELWDRHKMMRARLDADKRQLRIQVSFLLLYTMLAAHIQVSFLLLYTMLAAHMGFAGVQSGFGWSLRHCGGGCDGQEVGHL